MNMGRAYGPKSMATRAPHSPVLEPAPTLGLSRRRAALLLGGGLLATLSLVLLLPAFGDVSESLHRIGDASPAWLLAALGFEALSFLGHIILFRAVAVDGGSRIGMRASTEITFAGHAATRLFATAGAGGVALTAWAMRKSGLSKRDVASRMTTFLVLLYAVYMLALVVGGLGLYFGLMPGNAPLSLTLVPAAFGAFVILAALSLPLVQKRFAKVAPIADGVRTSVQLVRRGNPGLLGALLWWAGDIAVLWACFKAFGAAPPVAVVVVAYFVGMFANTLPLPGGVGGVDGGMVAALAAFGADPSLAVLAVLAYRFFAFWLPIAPGAVAWVSLRRTVARWEGRVPQRLKLRLPARRGAHAPQRVYV
jgi:uncharacterized membrane protein YbhN (UPF0104 family)